MCLIHMVSQQRQIAALICLAGAAEYWRSFVNLKRVSFLLRGYPVRLPICCGWRSFRRSTISFYLSFHWSGVGWIFFGKREEVVENLAIVVAILSALYLAQGLIFSLLLEAEWQILLDEVAGSSSLFFGKLFDTLAYVPFILVMLFEAAFWLVCCKWKEKKAVSREGNAAATGEEEGASSRQDAQMQLFERLRMLKQLYDEGALTEQEYEEQKMKLLDSGE